LRGGNLVQEGKSWGHVYGIKEGGKGSCSFAAGARIQGGKMTGGNTKKIGG